MSNENIKRFVDTFPFSFVDDAEFESKHKRDKEGKFAKTKTANAPKTYYASGKDLATLPRKKPISEYIEKMSQSDPADVFDDFVTQELRGGYIKSNFEKVGPVVLEMSRQVCDKFPFYIRKEIDPVVRQMVARRTLILADNLNDIIKTGRRSKWQANHYTSGKHEGDEFMKILKAYDDVDGSRFLGVAIIRKPKNAPTQSYALRVSGGHSLKKTMEGVKFKDENDNIVELVSLRVLDI